jgi:hypothetical protein
MADEAFALSPIHARASLPTDADYHAIHEAFMETSRGRWFLSEFARRNRNADTRMVLDAVERIEASLAGQKQAHAEAAAAEAEPQIDLWAELIKAFTRTRIEIAQRLVRESSEPGYEAIRAGAETIRSVSWALRERGFDSRICDILDVQVNAITDGYAGLMAESTFAGEAEAEILAAFDALIERVEGLTRGGDAETATLDLMVDAVADAMSEDDDKESPLADDAVSEDGTGLAAPAAEASQVETAQPEPAAAADVAGVPDAEFHEIYGDDSDIEIVDAAPLEEPPPPAPPTEPEINKQRLYDAKLAPYRSPAIMVETHARGIGPADDIEIVDAVDAETEGASPDPPPVQERAAPIAEAAPVPPADQARDKPASLGQALLANGVVPHRAGSRPDPLAPFRRMSQAEKVALFT